MIRWKRSWEDLPGSMPYDVMPVSNGEFLPPPPTEEQRLIMRLQEEEGERVRVRLGMSRREFVRSAAAVAVGLWAVQHVVTGGGARSALARHSGDPKGCTDADLHHPGAQLNNLPGEFILDLQTHHVDHEGLWRVSNPGFHAFFALVWPQSAPYSDRRCGELDPIECLGRYHYIKEIYLDSSTNAGVLSAVPSSPDRNPLPTHEAAETVYTVNGLADSERAVLHHFVMPNRGYHKATNLVGQKSIFHEQELEMMTAMKDQYGDILRAWKCYTPWGDIPNASGWFHDDINGRSMIEHALDIGVPVLCSHKGFALPSFDQASAACRDIGPVGRDYPGAIFVVYHSGFDGETQGAYPGDGVSSSDVHINGLIKSLRENGWSARNFAPGGDPGVPFADGDPEVHVNNPNVYGELGAVWDQVRNRATDLPDGSRQTGVQAAHLLGKLIYYLGPKRVVWGTDSLWFGSPQNQIARLREFPRANETEARRILEEVYHLPHGLDGHVDDPSVNAVTTGVPAKSIRNGIFGRNAAEIYGVDPDAWRGAIECDDLQAYRDGEYLQNRGTVRETRPMASNVILGPRNPREVLAGTWPNTPWSP